MNIILAIIFEIECLIGFIFKPLTSRWRNYQRRRRLDKIVRSRQAYYENKPNHPLDK